MSTDETPRVDPDQPIERGRCALCPSDRLCIWQCEHTRSMLEILMGEALAEQARSGLAGKSAEVIKCPRDILELYN